MGLSYIVPGPPKVQLVLERLELYMFGTIGAIPRKVERFKMKEGLFRSMHSGLSMPLPARNPMGAPGSLWGLADSATALSL